MIFVIDAAKKPLCMCHPAKARKLLRDDKAAVYRRYQMIRGSMPPEHLANWHGIPEYSVGIFPNHEILQEEAKRYGWAQRIVMHHNSRGKLDSFAVIQHDKLVLVFADHFTSDVGLQKLLVETDTEIGTLQNKERRAAA